MQTGIFPLSVVIDSGFFLRKCYKLSELLNLESLGIGINHSYNGALEGLVKSVESKKKARISIAIDREFLVWIDQMIEKGVFANRSHAIHRALLKLKEEVSK